MFWPFLISTSVRYYTITFVNDKCLSKSDVWYIFSKVTIHETIPPYV